MNRHTILRSLCMVLLFAVPTWCFAQTPGDDLPGDPGAITVSTFQNMHFGAFSQGNTGGTITLSNAGIRSSGGTVLLLSLGSTWYDAIFEIEAPANTLLSVSAAPTTTLTGSNGGTMTLTLGTPNLGSPFVTTIPPPGRTQLRIGGTLSVGNNIASPPGIYTGSFYITINNE